MTYSYFDETIFHYGESLYKYGKINAFNDADSFLLVKQGLLVGTENDVGSEKTTVNLNPRSPSTLGIDIYSMDKTNLSSRGLVTFNQISVYDGDTTTPIVLGTHIPGQIYNVGKLTGLESAIMLKYHAVNNSDVYITNHLYAYVRSYFNDDRAWFKSTSVGIVQNNKKELILNNKISNIPPLNFSTEEIDYN